MDAPDHNLKYTEDYYVKILLNKIKLKEIMISPVISVLVSAPFHEVADKIVKNRIRHLPVVDEHNKLVGLMTERDLFKIQSPRRLEDGTLYYDREALDNFILGSVMIQNPFSLQGENTVGEAVLKMVESKYGCIPITTKEGVLCGIVSYIDILALAARILKEK